MRDTIISVLLLVAVLPFCVSSCTSVPTDPTPKQQLVANAVEDVLSVGLVPVLTKNPAYLGEARTVAALLGSFSGVTLTTDDVDTFLARTSMTPTDRQTIAGLVNAAWATYQKRYAEQVGQSLRPDVKLFLNAVSRGILNAVAAVPVS